jgi:hypothetical protein
MRREENRFRRGNGELLCSSLVAGCDFEKNHTKTCRLVSINVLHSIVNASARIE